MALEATGVPRGEAERLAKEALEEAIERSKASGFYGRGPMGKTALGWSHDPKGARQAWEATRADGVTDADILEWWDLSSVERQMIVADDNLARMTEIMGLVEKSWEFEEAARECAKSNAIFGDCMDEKAMKGENRPLPWELKLRYMRWLAKKKTALRFAGVASESEGFASANAYIRHLIRLGEL
jgi:hypothetical protein